MQRGQKSGRFHGQQLPNGTVVIRGDANKLRQVNCPRCHLELNARSKANGDKVLKCPRCGWQGRSVVM